MSAGATTALILGGIGFAAIALAADATLDQWSYGQQEYQSKCAVCHGASGKGDGLMAWALDHRPSDLTTFADRYGDGSFPTQLAVETIDGRPHGDGSGNPAREMPIWGSEYREALVMSAEPPVEPEWHVRTRIEALTVYLSSLQVK